MGTLRIENHPVLGPAQAGRTVVITLDGQPLEAVEGEPVAAALAAAGIRAFRTTAVRSEPRGIFCAIGRCTDCMMVVDGVPNTRVCVTPVREGMKLERQHGLAPVRKPGDPA